ncbi:MAG TPA: enoyl-CoA hydratase/isomerase family protein, partial [Gemmatimonadaceae bacterium]|nr:enoyl-CoA hydratase/isomerase family protein [Gemmatimonadaceae bacterium]
MSGDPSKKAASQDHRPSGAYIQRMPSYDFITFEVADRIATITVNRPDKLNALNSGTIAELGAAIDDARVRQDVGGVILTGAGRAFIAGADISELQGQSPFVA